MKSTSLFFLSFHVLSQTLEFHVFSATFSRSVIHICSIVDAEIMDLGALRVRLFISDLLRFKFWILGLPPEDSNPSRHSDIRDDRDSNLLYIYNPVRGPRAWAPTRDPDGGSGHPDGGSGWSFPHFGFTSRRSKKHQKSSTSKNLPKSYKSGPRAPGGAIFMDFGWHFGIRFHENSETAETS
jgi:hypothetical protein